ncbi:extracellular solute-binding protein [Photobacterium lipolyticum]|uniref:ABC transporter substrate-binding protein n=1 Tax=Photobacterium lipolyticum TaxID=266810 RepID=A0A2T3MTR7_9GAMM|nr:extracellular solute-binding protein [Photobacterium lipolyticum]PSW02674.1 ABC transporter substrate-binding protein [Photobacterium lipolyticum]
MKKILITTLLTAISMLFQGGALAAELPSGLTWISNTEQPLFADKNAKSGGTYRLHIASFPLTLRTIGPDSNGSFRAFLLDGNPALLQQQPNTREYIPAIAKQWAFGDDHKTLFFKIDEDARWSDGTPITSQDFSFVFDYMRSDHVKAPWYKDFYTNKIAGITVYDKHTFALHSADQLSNDELLMRLNIMPKPTHFYANGIPKDFVKRYNWKAEPVTGPYKVGKVRKGKSIQLVKVKDWWGYKNPYYQHRYNVNKIIIKVIRDTDIAIKYFEKGELDAFYMVFPSVWHDKAKGKLYDQGYIHKAWLYNKYPQGAAGVWLNLDAPHMDDENIRHGIAHSLNVQKMIDVALRGDYVRLQGFGSGYGQYDNPEIQAKTFDPQLASRYFEQAGYKQLDDNGIRINNQGEKLAITLTYLSKMHTARVIVLKEEARKTGLDIELKLVDGATGFKALLEKKHQAAFLGMGSGQLPVYWQYFHSSNAQPQSNNFTNFAGQKMDQLINAYDSEFTIEKKASLSRQIQRLISDCDCVIPTYSVPFSRGAYWRYVKLPEGLGTELSRDILDAKSMEYGLFWIDIDEKAQTKQALRAGKTFPPVTIIDKRYIQG